MDSSNARAAVVEIIEALQMVQILREMLLGAPLTPPSPAALEARRNEQ